MCIRDRGKTTLGNALAEMTKGSFYDGDDFHPDANREKMASGQPLNDDDRRPWLETLAGLIAQKSSEKSPSFIACSALKESYRDILKSGSENLVFLHLHTDPEVLRQRITERYESGEHFMPPSLLNSQLQTLELPDEALFCDVSKSLEEILELIAEKYPHLKN